MTFARLFGAKRAKLEDFQVNWDQGKGKELDAEARRAGQLHLIGKFKAMAAAQKRGAKK